jgi:hypothetical protein
MTRLQEVLCLLMVYFLVHTHGLLAVSSHDGRTYQCPSGLFYEDNNAICENYRLVI